jgi:hypothetical protein
VDIRNHDTRRKQGKLFDLPAALPNGLVYRPDFLDAELKKKF